MDVPDFLLNIIGFLTHNFFRLLIHLVSLTALEDLGVTMGQTLSLPMVFVGSLLVFLSLNRRVIKLTRLFKLPLYIFILVCVLWALYFLVVQLLLPTSQNLILMKSESVHRVQVTPNLDIKIGRLEFDFPNHGRCECTNWPRACSLIWNGLSLTQNRRLISPLNPTKIVNDGTFENTNFILFFNNWFDFLTP